MGKKKTDGWIKLHRCLLDNPIARRPHYCHLWTTLLLLAQHQARTTEYIWQNRKCSLASGQLLTGRKALSKQTGIHESSVQRILKYLENEHQIEQQKTTKFRVITIINWEKYQHNENGEHQSEQQANNRRTTGEHIQEGIRKSKKEKKGETHFQKPTPQEVTEYAKSIDFTLDGQYFVDSYEAKGWLVGKTPMRDWKAAVRTWKHRDKSETEPQTLTAAEQAAAYEREEQERCSEQMQPT